MATRPLTIIGILITCLLSLVFFSSACMDTAAMTGPAPNNATSTAKDDRSDWERRACVPVGPNTAPIALVLHTQDRDPQAIINVLDGVQVVTRAIADSDSVVGDMIALGLVSRPAQSICYLNLDIAPLKEEIRDRRVILITLGLHHEGMRSCWTLAEAEEQITACGDVYLRDPSAEEVRETLAGLF
jgi:hypothetical protein